MSSPWQLSSLDEASVVRLADVIALKLRPGDVIALQGDLGAGKTTFARSLIRAVLADFEHEVPSPTFALLQPYDSERLKLSHLDLYRLQDHDELVELGLDDHLARGAVVIEWADRLSAPLSSNTLHISFGDGRDTDHRDLTLSASGTWVARLARVKEIVQFLDAQKHWRAARLTYLQGDASARSYARFVGGPAPALLMDSPAQPDGPPLCDGQTYSQLAGLAEDVRPFIAIAGALADNGLAAPRLDATDTARGLLIVEDFGDLVFGQALGEGYDQPLLWRTAVDVLLALRNDIADHTWSFPDETHYRLPVFSSRVMQTECGLLLDWYWPYVKGAQAPDAARDEFCSLTAPIFERSALANRNWVLRDFHSPNLIWRPDQTGIARVGVIDFQDALRGPPEYDLVSLLQDARLDVPPQLEQDLLRHYLAGAADLARQDPSDDFDEAETLFRYSALGAQRAMKILGIFARLAIRDAKPHYLEHIPRIWRYLEHNLAHSDLSDLRNWLDQHFEDDVRITPAVS